MMKAVGHDNLRVQAKESGNLFSPRGFVAFQILIQRRPAHIGTQVLEPAHIPGWHGGDIGLSGYAHAAPEPRSTAGMVRSRILKSSHSDHLSMYCKSSSIHCSKAIELRPATCHRQVMPGFTLKRRRCQSSLKPSQSRTGSGRGPTRLMSPLKTLNSWGSSSMLVFLRNLPTGVIRGSFLILNTGPLTSFKCSISRILFSASTTIVRNL